MNHSLIICVSLIVLLFVSSVYCLPFVQIDGIGSSFPAPVFGAQLDYYTKSSAFTSKYQGSGLYSGLSDDVAPSITEYAKRSQYEFLATDTALTPTQVSSLRQSNANKQLLHIPHVLTGVVICYNIPNYTGPSLNFTADLFISIFSKQITNWNDAQILAINPALQDAINAGLDLNGKTILRGARSDASSTTYEITDYLTRFASAGKWSGGARTSVQAWLDDADITKKDDGGPMANWVRDTQYSISYAKKKTAQPRNIGLASLKNVFDKFIFPSDSSLTIASLTTSLPDITSDQWFNISMGTRSTSPDTYPATYFSYVVIFEYRADAGYDYANITATYDFINFINTDNTVDTKLPAFFVPIPQSLKDKNIVAIKQYLLNPSQSSSAYGNNINMMMIIATVFIAIFINKSMH